MCAADTPPRGLDGLATASQIAAEIKAATADDRAAAFRAALGIDALDDQRAAPTHLWSPPDCGDLDIRVARDGAWWYLGTPIGREPLVKLFASVLTREADGRHFLVTPGEKIGIAVDDVAFVAVDVEMIATEAGPVAVFETNVGDRIALRRPRSLRLVVAPDTDEPIPYLPVRGRLEARVDRKSFYRLVDLCEFRDTPGEAGGLLRAFGFVSGGDFHALAVGEAAERIEAAAG